MKNRVFIYPGSFNPMHDGHRAIANAIQATYPEHPLFLEFSTVNADKGIISDEEKEKRIRHIESNGYKCAHTNKSLFVDKLNYFHELYSSLIDFSISFVCGVDVWNKIWDVKYGVSLEDLNRAFSEKNANFHVFGRGGVSPVVNNFNKDLLESYTPFRIDISSSEIRAKMRNK